jgi:hypothetical protein
MNTLMLFVFLVLAAAMMFTVLVRLLFHASYREPDGHALNRFLETCRAASPLKGCSSLGWLGELLDALDFDRHEFRRAVEHFRSRTLWCHGMQRILGVQATAIGMLFTLVSLTTAATGTLDPTVVIAVGVKSSVYGMVIAIWGTTLHDVFQGRVDRFLDQADAVLEALDSPPRVIPTAIPVPALASVPAGAGPAYCRRAVAFRDPPIMATTANERVPVYQTESARPCPSIGATGTIAGHQGDTMRKPDNDGNHDDNFAEQAVDWVSEVNWGGPNHG